MRYSPDNLRTAELNIALARRHVERQRKVIVDLATRGRSTVVARRVLEQLEISLKQELASLDALMRSRQRNTA